MIVRSATPSDLAAVAAIYDEEVLTGISTFDTEPRPADYWRSRLHSTEAGDRFLVADDDGVTIGFACSSSYRPRPAYARTRETSLYLARQARGQGIGKALYATLLDQIRADGTHTAVAVIAQPNPASEALHVACGFERVGLVPQVGRKFDRWIDTAFYALVL